MAPIPSQGFSYHFPYERQNFYGWSPWDVLKMGNLDEWLKNDMNTKPGRMFFVFDSSRLCNMCAVCVLLTKLMLLDGCSLQRGNIRYMMLHLHPPPPYSNSHHQDYIRNPNEKPFNDCQDKMLGVFWEIPFGIPFSKLTWQWNITIFNRKYIFKWSVFHCHVSLPEGTPCLFLPSL